MEILVQCDGMEVWVEFYPRATLAAIIEKHHQRNAEMGCPAYPTFLEDLIAEGYLELPDGVVRVYNKGE